MNMIENRSKNSQSIDFDFDIGTSMSIDRKLEASCMEEFFGKSSIEKCREKMVDCKRFLRKNKRIVIDWKIDREDKKRLMSKIELNEKKLKTVWAFRKFYLDFHLELLSSLKLRLLL